MSSHARFVHLELLTPSLKQSIPFLAELLDLDVVFVEGESPFYGLAARGADIPFFAVSEFEPAPEIQSHWVGHVASSDLAGAIANVRARDGFVYLSPEETGEFEGEADEVPPMHLIGDPFGAVLALIPDEPSPAVAAVTSGALGAPTWFELLTTDVEIAAAFHEAVVGWELGPAEDRGDEGPGRVLRWGGHPYGLIRALPAGAPMSPLWVPFFRVADLAASLARVRALGGFFFEDPADVPGGRRAIVIEPTGATVGLWQLAR